MAVTEAPLVINPRTVQEPALVVEGLRKVYASRRKGDVVAVDDVGFAVEGAGIVGLLGPNGAGKTTTIKCICTLIHPSEGNIRVGGVDAIRHPRRAVEQIAAVLEGNRNVYWRLTPTENLELFAGLHGIPAKRVKPIIADLLEAFSLTDKTKAEARTLSRGMQQKLAVACAFVKQTPLLLLDEPTLGLDLETSHELRLSLKQMAREGGRTILLSSHDMDVVQDVCDRVIIINKGRIVTDDSVTNLLDLFRVRAYRFNLASGLDAAQMARVTQAFPLAAFQNETNSSIEVQFTNGKDIYDFVELLRTFGSEIDSIDHRDPDMAEIFLTIVKREGRQ